MGEAYEDGVGVPPDRTEAKKWYAKSCERGHEPSCDWLLEGPERGECAERFAAAVRSPARKCVARWRRFWVEIDAPSGNQSSLAGTSGFTFSLALDA